MTERQTGDRFSSKEVMPTQSRKLTVVTGGQYGSE